MIRNAKAKPLRAADEHSLLCRSRDKSATMRQSEFPPGWDEEKVHRVLAHYEEQTEEEAVAEDEAAFEDQTQTLMEIPNELVPVVRELIAKRRA